jgi:hypothetical protein
MVDDTVLRMCWPKIGSLPRSHREMWIVILRELLCQSFNGWTIEVVHDQYDQFTTVEIRFANAEDLIMFVLKWM